MIFKQRVSVPKSTVAATPLITPWKLAKGLFYRFDLRFPPGPLGLVGVAVRTAIHQIYPADSDQWFTGDNTAIVFDDTFQFDTETNQVEIYAYNLDDYYDHMFDIMIGIETDPELIKSRFGYAHVDSLITTLEALTSLLVLQNTVSGKFSKEGLSKL